MRISHAALPALFLAVLAACNVTPDPPEVAACKAAVISRSTTGVAPSLTVLSNQPVIDGKMVRLQEGNGTAWRCITDLTGFVTELDLDV